MTSAATLVAVGALALLLGATAGALFVWVYLSAQLRRSRTEAASAEALLEDHRQRIQLMQESMQQERRTFEDTLRKERGAAQEALLTERGAREEERLQRSSAEVRLEEAMRNLSEQREHIERIKEELSTSFQALSAQALKSSNEEFLRLASERMGHVLSETTGRLGQHKTALQGMITPLSESLKRYEEYVRAVEMKRGSDHAGLDEQIRMLVETQKNLRTETGNLVTALRKPHVRGRWGEITLRNVVEMAGMSSKCDFTEQLSLNSEDGRLRPDMVIHMPGGHSIVVDSKVSLEALLDAAASSTDEERAAQLKRHASHVREQVNRLGSKSYWQQFEKAPELAVLFISEAALTAALDVDQMLIEDSMQKRILISTPTTLFALLTAVTYGWRQEQIARNAEEIASLGRELYERIKVWSKHMGEIGGAIGKSVDVYNKSVGSLEARVLPQVRRFKELGAASSEQIERIEQIHKMPRTPETPEIPELTD